MDVKNVSKPSFSGTIKLSWKNHDIVCAIKKISIEKYGDLSSEETVKRCFSTLTHKTGVTINFKSPELETSALEYLRTKGIDNYVYWSKPNLTKEEYQKISRLKVII